MSVGTGIGADGTHPGPRKAEPGVIRTAHERRRIAISALSRELDGDEPTSAASRLGAMLSSQNRPMVVSGDIDGVVSAAMLGSVAKSWEIVAFSMQSSYLLVHPSVADQMPDDLFGVDVFSPGFDNVSNHVVEFGSKKVQNKAVLSAFNTWDLLVKESANLRLLAVPAMWAGTQACYTDADHATGAKYKYPFGTAQILLAMLEAAGHAPKFFDRTYLPWLVANCDGGVSSYSRHAYNARVWWPVMAGAVGPWSLTEQIYRMVDSMRPHDFLDAVARLDRERQANDEDRWLNDDWNLAGQTAGTLQRCLRWLFDLTGWRDSVRGGVDSLSEWKALDTRGSGQVYITSAGPKDSVLETNLETIVMANKRPDKAAELILGATHAVNANFYLGGMTGSRFNWTGGWGATTD